MKRGDEGVTLVELLVCIAIMGIVASALTVSFFASTRSIDQSSLRMADTHDSQMAATLFSSDMQSANWIWTDTPVYPFQTCGTGQPLVTFAWPGSDSQGNELTKVATYGVTDQNGEHQLVRYFCSGSGFGTTPTSTVVIAHNLYGTPSVACFGPANAPLPSCDGSVMVAQLTATAQSSAADPTGFPYVLRATRRPTLPPSPPPSTPTPVQPPKANKQISGTTTAVTFDQANTAGNLIVAYVVWDNPGAVSVTDSNGNVYTPASPSVTWTAFGSKAEVFYASNVAGGTNTVTATFATGLSTFGLLYVTEYSGIDKTDPVDQVSTGGVGTGANMTSGTVTTTNANDLLVGLGASLNGTAAGGAGYTSHPDNYGNVVEERTVTTVGDYTATGTQSGPAWVMQLVAFKADAGGPPSP